MPSSGNGICRKQIRQQQQFSLHQVKSILHLGTSYYYVNVLRKRKMKKFELLKTSWTYQTQEYFKNSTLHGVRYIAEEGRPFFEKFIWFLSTATGGIVTIIIIVTLWEKFQTNPTITGLDTDFHNWDVEFPGVTVCQQFKVNETLVDELIERKYKNFKNNNLLKDYFMVLGDLSFAQIDMLQNFTKNSNLPQGDFREIILQVVNRCHEVMSDCFWKDAPVPCCEKFLPVITERGFCYAFNTRQREIVMPEGSDYEKIPRFQQEYIFETDAKWAITVNFTDVEENPVKVYIHPSKEEAGIDLESQHLWNRKVKRIAFSAKTTYTTEDAKQLSIRQRRCVFEDEIKLINSEEYTYAACMRECRIKLAVEKCRCIPYFYRSIPDYPDCTLRQLACIISNKETLTSKGICMCELGCSNTVYEVDKLLEKDEITKVPALEISFVSWPMIRYKREVLFGWVDLLVAFGGIAGLFLGFSLLSGVEIIYYFTMRSFCMYIRDKEELKNLRIEYEKKEKPPLDLSLTPYFMKKRKKENIPIVGNTKSFRKFN